MTSFTLALCLVWTDAGLGNVKIVDDHSRVTDMTKLSPIHPGEVLKEEFIEPLVVRV